MWMKVSTYIRKVASEEFGVTKGGGGMRRCKMLLRRGKCFRRMHLDRSVDNVERTKWQRRPQSGR
jgi:hypothetical protein